MIGRNDVIALVDVGRSLGIIEQTVRDLNATAAVDDKRAAVSVENAYSAALLMVRSLDAIRRRNY